MDLKKAKIILIVFFSLINILLMSILIFSNDTNKVSNDIINNVRALFDNKGIQILCDIPTDIDPAPQLEMGEDVIGGRQGDKNFFNNELDFDTSKYILFYDFGDTRVYAQTFEGKIILENRIIEDDTGIDYTKREIIAFEKSKKNIIPAHAVLLKAYLNSDIQQIQKIEMVYLKYIDDNIFGPVWCIIADNKARYFYALEAFNGLEMDRIQ